MSNPDPKSAAEPSAKKPDPETKKEERTEERAVSRTGPRTPDRAQPVVVVIVHGTYVHRPPETAGEEPGDAAVGDVVEVTEREARRLIGLGVAKLR